MVFFENIIFLHKQYFILFIFVLVLLYIYYKNKKKSVKVAYLTAADENILSSQNLISSGKVIDELLRRKVLDKDLSVDEIVEEDRQAILIFLRKDRICGRM